jgi:PQQ-like domain
LKPNTLLLDYYALTGRLALRAHPTPHRSGTRFRENHLLTSILLAAGFLTVSLPVGYAAPAITVVPGSSPPERSISVSGSGFAPSEPVDIYFDATDLQLALADPTGNFSSVLIEVPAGAIPGEHGISAVGRKTEGGAQTQLLVGTNWPEIGFGPRGTRNNFSENVLAGANASTLDTLWVASTAGYIISSPAVVNAVVYVGSLDGNIYAFNAITGKQLWSATIECSIYGSSPAVVNGVVYIGSLDNNLYAFNATTGAKLWSANAGGVNLFLACGGQWCGLCGIGGQPSLRF